MLSPTRTVKNVNVRRLFLGVTFQRLNIVILWMPATRTDLLIVFQVFDMALL